MDVMDVLEVKQRGISNNGIGIGPTLLINLSWSLDHIVQTKPTMFLSFSFEIIQTMTPNRLMNFFNMDSTRALLYECLCVVDFVGGIDLHSLFNANNVSSGKTFKAEELC